jgi:hypothetical protein
LPVLHGIRGNIHFAFRIKYVLTILFGRETKGRKLIN